jgi:DNA-binding GntR family transcriptional regulator
MRMAVQNRDLDSYVEHDVKFRHSILRASENDLLLRIWDSLSFDIRLRAVIGEVSGNLTEVVESHQSIINDLENGHGKEAGLLLRNNAETFLQFLKKAERDSGIYLQLDFAKSVQEAFSRNGVLRFQA